MTNQSQQAEARAIVADRAMGRTEAAAFLAVGVQTFDRLRRQPGFPRGHVLGAAARRWLASELLAWAKAQPAESSAAKEPTL